MLVCLWNPRFLQFLHIFHPNKTKIFDLGEFSEIPHFHFVSFSSSKNVFIWDFTYYISIMVPLNSLGQFISNQQVTFSTLAVVNQFGTESQ